MSDTIEVPTTSTSTASVTAQRLAAILDDAQTLFVDAEYLQAQAGDIFVGLEEISKKDPAANSDAAFHDALETAKWLDSVANTVESEADHLVVCLLEATDRDLVTALAA